MKAEQEGERGFQVTDSGEPEAGALPPMTFVTLVLSLSTSALVHLGAAPGGGGEEPAEKNLPLAKQTIDILEVLREKTRGNLTDEEEKLFESVLHDLRMRFVQAS